MSFIKKLKRILGIIKSFHEVKGIRNEIFINRMLTAKLMNKLNLQNSSEIIKNLHKAEFQVFSQWGDDGIIQFLINYLDIEDKRFVEFGVENYLESNTRYLLINDNWKGLCMDGSVESMNFVKDDPISWKYNLTSRASFITKENINDILLEENFTGDLGLFHIDIDGNDYWIWEALKVVNPIIMIVEYNSVFGPKNMWTIPYKSDFYRLNHHYSNMFYGVSLNALCKLADEKGYYFICCNSNGNNAFFVRKDKIKDLVPLTAEQGYVKSMFREGKDKLGKLSYVSDDERLNALRGLVIYNIETNQLEKI